jgi:hypothetical protein
MNRKCLPSRLIAASFFAMIVSAVGPILVRGAIKTLSAFHARIASGVHGFLEASWAARGRWISPELTSDMSLTKASLNQ